MVNANGAGAVGRMVMMRAGGRVVEAGLGGLNRGRQEADKLAAETFEDLFARYEQKIFNLIFRMVGDYEEAVDLTSDTFVQALKGLPNFRRQSQPYTWLYRIAVNLCKNHFRKKAHRARFFAFSLDRKRDSEEGGEAPEIEDYSQEPGRLVENQELQQQVQKAIAALPADLRTAVVLRDLQGLSYREIAEVVDCSLEAVKSRLFRARGILRERLAAYLSEAGESSAADMG
jgi:RNA polymerase sigma-70 factor (ECF subfamily)